MKIALLGILFFNFMLALGQSEQMDIDSLRSEIDKYPDFDTLKINSVIHLATALGSNSEEYSSLVEEAYRQSQVGRHPRQLATAAHLLGVEEFYAGNYETSEEYIQEAIDIARLNDLQFMLATYLSDLGQIEDALGKDKKSIEHTLEAIRILEDIDSPEMLVSAYNNLAGFYYYRNNLDGAIEYYFKAKDLLISRLSLKENYSIWAITESNIGWCYYYKNDLPQAIDQLKRGVEIHTKYDYYSPASGNSRSNLASLYVESEQFDLAKIHASDALDISLEIGYTQGIGNAYNVLGEIAFAQKRFSEAASAYGEALTYADSLGDLYEQVRRSELLAKSYRELGNYHMAYNFVQLSKELNDSLRKMESDAAFEDAVTKYETEKAESENELLQKESELKDVQLDQERLEAKSERERNFLIGGAIALILISGLFFLINRNRLKSRINSQLQQQRDEIAEQKQEITDSITYAKRIQGSFLPNENEFHPHFEESFLMYEPKDIVAGDFYILEEAGDYIFFSVADCTGHGVPGAMVSIVCSNAIRKVLHEMNEYDPGKVLDKTRDIVISQFERKGHTVNDGMDISFCRLDKKTNKLAWAGANSSVLIINSNGVLNEIKPTKQPIGGYVTSDPFTTHEIQLQKGDRIYMSSDGYPDQFGGEKGKKYKYKRFKELLVRNYKESMQKQKANISTEFWEWKQGFEQIDDVCVMGVKI